MSDWHLRGPAKPDLADFDPSFGSSESRKVCLAGNSSPVILDPEMIPKYSYIARDKCEKFNVDSDAPQPLELTSADVRGII